MIRIVGTGSFAPERILDNAELERMVDTSDEWITSRTGIKKRHIAGELTPTSDLAAAAARRALEAANMKPEELDAIIVATITHDKIFPSTACILQNKIGAVNAFCFDLAAACSGLLYGVETADALLTAKKYRSILVVGAEKLSSLVDWSDRGTCVLFGDGAGALVMRRDDDGEGSCVVASELGANGEHENILHVPAGGSAMPPSRETVDGGLHYMRMEGQEVFKLAVNAMVGSCRKVLDAAGVNAEQVRWLVPHQANLRILKAVGSRLKMPDDRIYINVDRYGNTSAASIGIAVDEIVRSGQVSQGDYVLLTAFGGGLTWGAILIRW